MKYYECEKQIKAISDSYEIAQKYSCAVDDLLIKYPLKESISIGIIEDNAYTELLKNFQYLKHSRFSSYSCTKDICIELGNVLYNDYTNLIQKANDILNNIQFLVENIPESINPFIDIKRDELNTLINIFRNKKITNNIYSKYYVSLEGLEDIFKTCRYLCCTKDSAIGKLVSKELISISLKIKQKLFDFSIGIDIPIIPD